MSIERWMPAPRAGTNVGGRGPGPGPMNRVEGPSIDELMALRAVDRADRAALLHDVLDGAPGRLSARPDPRLRLPVPPVPPRGPDVVVHGLRGALAAFEAGRQRPVLAAEAAVVAEARMMAVLSGMLRLHGQVRGRREGR